MTTKLKIKRKLKLKHSFCAAMVAAVAVAAGPTWAEAGDRTVNVGQVGHTGPIVVPRPVMVDTVDLRSKPFNPEALLDYDFNLLAPATSTLTLGEGAAPSDSATMALHILQFAVESPHYIKANLNVKGLPNHKVFVDNAPLGGTELGLDPGTHRVAIKYVTDSVLRDTLAISLTCDSIIPLTLRTDGRRLFSFDDNMNNTRVYSAVPSPDGKYLIYTTYTTTPDGEVAYNSEMRLTSTGERLRGLDTQARWMPRSSRLYTTRKGRQGRLLITMDPLTGAETVLCEGLPEGNFTFAPTEDFLVYTIEEEGEKEKDADVHQILNPEDRLQGWRKRTRLARYNLATGLMEPLTFGYRNTWLADIAQDGKSLLFSTLTPRFTKRPTALVDLLRLNLETMAVDTLVRADGFVEGAMFSPDGTQVLITGSPEALGGIGNRVPDGRIPSMIDRQMFLMDIASGKVTPLTADFDPNVVNVAWNPGDGQIYFTCEEGDLISLFRLDPATGKFTKIPVPEEYVSNFAIADFAPVGAAVGQGSMSGGGAYSFDTRKFKMNNFDRPFDAQLAEVDLPKCEPWYYVNEQGDSIQCRFYLPANFDPSQKYPMIVNYYGGCSPISRYFGGHYPHQLYTSLGYVAMVVEPSGSTGYGQEFSARHVKTAGEGVAQDIIGAVSTFAKEHPFVNADKIGCVGASYGGFMTMYLQTLTDMFAAAVAHAGISDHTSYWGEGDWGYSYSQTSMGDAFPWSDPDLYVKQSPLYRADKVHTPLLFLHGSIDNNVPIGESIQMFNALSLLGQPTAFVVVDGERHGIMDYFKRLKWQRAMLAWFAKYLQDDPTWWDALYPPKAL